MNYLQFDLSPRQHSNFLKISANNICKNKPIKIEPWNNSIVLLENISAQFYPNDAYPHKYHTKEEHPRHKENFIVKKNNYSHSAIKLRQQNIQQTPNISLQKNIHINQNSKKMESKLKRFLESRKMLNYNNQTRKNSNQFCSQNNMNPKKSFDKSFNRFSNDIDSFPIDLVSNNNKSFYGPRRPNKKMFILHKHSYLKGQAIINKSKSQKQPKAVLKILQKYQLNKEGIMTNKIELKTTNRFQNKLKYPQKSIRKLKRNSKATATISIQKSRVDLKKSYSIIRYSMV